jgi:hypothetical protein
MSKVVFIPLKQRNSYTVWYKYANKKLNKYNRIAMHYNLERLQFPLNIPHPYAY